MERVVVCGIGDIYRGDDGIGPEVVERLRGRVRDALLLSSHNPGMFLNRIREYRPERVILITASNHKRAPGAVEILNTTECKKMLEENRLTQRAMFVGYLERSTDAEIITVNMQPESLRDGHVLSPVARNAVIGITERVRDLLMQ